MGLEGFRCVFWCKPELPSHVALDFLQLCKWLCSHHLLQIVSTSIWPNSCHSSGAHYHRAAFGINRLFICCMSLPACFQINSTCCRCCRLCRLVTWSTGSLNTGCKYLYSLSFCLCVNCSMSERGITNGMWVMGCTILGTRETEVKGIRWDRVEEDEGGVRASWRPAPAALWSFIPICVFVRACAVRLIGSQSPHSGSCCTSMGVMWLHFTADTTARNT